MWHNWSAEHNHSPSKQFYPKDRYELADIIKMAKRNKKQVRAVGHGHSFSDIVACDDYLIHTDKLTKLSLGSVLSADKYGNCHHTVKAQAGASVKQLDNFLAKHGLVIGSNILLTSVRLGGIVATGSHGTGIDYSTISDRVYEISIMDSFGQLILYSEDEQGAHRSADNRNYDLIVTEKQAVAAAKLNLGLLGIIYEVTLRVEANFKSHCVSQLQPAATVLTEDFLAANLQPGSWLDMYQFAFSNLILTKQARRLSGQANHSTVGSPVNNNLIGRLTDGLLAGYIWLRYLMESGFTLLMAKLGGYMFQFKTDSWISRLVRLLTGRSYTGADVVHYAGSHNFFFFPLFDRVQSQWFNVHYSTFIDYSPKVHNPECVVMFNNDKAGRAKIIKCIQAAKALVDSYYEEKKQAPCIFGINIRFTAASDCLLSPAYSKDKKQLAMWIEIILSPTNDGWRQLCDDFNTLMIKSYTASVHWPKSWYAETFEQAELITSNNRQRLQQFMETRAKLKVDNRNMFLTPALRAIFDPNKQ